MSNGTGGMRGGGAARLIWLGAQFVLATAAAIILGLSVQAERYILVGVLLGGAAVLLSALDWRRHLIPLIFAYMCVEGFVSLLFPQHKVALLIKDFLIIIAYTSFLAEVVAAQKFVFFRGILVPMAVLALLGVVEIFNPTPGHTVLMGLVGFKILCFYMPLIFLGYYCFQTVADLKRFIRYLLFLSVPMALMAGWQYVEGPNALTRFGGGFYRAVIMSTGSAYGEHLRAIGTFSSPGMLAGFAFSLTAVGIMHYGMVKGAGKRLSCVLLLLVAAMTMLLSGTRGALLGTAAMAGTIFLLVGRFRQLAGGLVLFVTAVLLVVGFLGEAVLGRLGTLLDPHIYLNRATMPFSGLFEALANAPLGLGLGSASVGARHVAPGGKVLILGEQYLTKIIYEMGWFGLFSFVWLLVSSLAQGLRCYRNCLTAETKWAAGCLAVFVLAQLVLALEGAALDAIPINVFFWFFMGIMLKTPELKAEPEKPPSWRPAPVEPAGGYAPGGP